MDGTGGCKVDLFFGNRCLVCVIQLWKFQAREVDWSQMQDVVNHLVIHLIGAFQIPQTGFCKIELVWLDKEDDHIIKAQIPDLIVEAWTLLHLAVRDEAIVQRIWRIWWSLTFCDGCDLILKTSCDAEVLVIGKDYIFVNANGYLYWIQGWGEWLRALHDLARVWFANTLIWFDLYQLTSGFKFIM